MRAVLLTAVAAFVLAGCAAVKPSAEEHAAHHPQGEAVATRADQQMKMMQEMHQKMMGAKTPQERQALMAEHMKAMQDGMSMMCEMGSSMGVSGGPGAQGRPANPDMMNRCMQMRDMTMRMMMDRESAPAAAPR